MLTFTLAISLVTAIVFGLAPALRVTSLDLSASLKEHSAGQGSARRGGTLRRLLVAGQVGLSLLLLIGASLFLRSLINIRGLDPGFNPERLLLVTLRSDWYRLSRRASVRLLPAGARTNHDSARRSIR